MNQYAILLNKSVQNDDLQSVRCILELKKHDFLSLDTCVNKKSKETILHLAAKFGSVDIMKYLISEGCLIDFPDIDGKTALHYACQYENVMCAQILIKSGSDVNSLKKADWTPLMLGCAKGNYDIIKLLLNSGAFLSLKNKDGWTAFHIACRCGNADVINYMLDVDSNLWLTVSKNGRTPLHTAALNGCLSVCKVLLSRCTYQSVDDIDSCGCTPFMDAIRAGHVDIARLLQTHGSDRAVIADLYKLDCMGRHSIHICCESGQIASLKYLINDCMINVNLQTRGGMTPLHYAAKEGHEHIVALLVSQEEIDVNAIDKWNRTALDLASKHGGCMQIIKEIGGKYGNECSDIG